MSSTVLANLSKKIKDAAAAAGLVELNQFSQLFQENDVKKKGFVDVNKEMPPLFKKFGFVVSLTNRKNVARLFDPDNTGKITESQFVTFFSPEVSDVRMDSVNKAAKKLSGGDSKITRESLEELLKTLPGDGEFVRIAGRRVKKEEWLNSFFETFDANNSEEVMCQEFINKYKQLSDSYESDECWNKMIEASWTF